MSTPNLKARLRTEKGTRACRKLRRAGEIPANLYGASKQDDGPTKLHNVDLAVSAYEMLQFLEHEVSLVNVTYDGKSEPALIKDVHRDVFGDDILHVDFEMVDVTQKLQTSAALAFKGDSKGVMSGGRMQIDLHDLEIECLPTAIPSHIDVRIDELEIGQSLHVSDLVLPEGVVAITNSSQSVVQVVAVEEPVEPEAGEDEGAAEPELIKKKDSEEGGE